MTKTWMTVVTGRGHFDDQGKDMIIVKIDAGLGNQMLEYCFYRQLKDEYPQCVIKTDMDRWIYKKYVPHYGYELKKVFGININDVATTDEILMCGGEYQRKSPMPWDVIKKKYYNNLRRIPEEKKVFRVHQKDWKVFVKKHEHEIEECNCWIDNSWNWIYEPAIPDFKYAAALEGKNAKAAEEMKKHDSVSVHIRRGDYVGSSYDVLTMDYYLNSIDFMCEHLDDPALYFFSDDPEYVRQKFAGIGIRHEIVDWNKGGDSHFDMQLMSACSHNIICNSTFSLWGAVLNCAPDKLVIKPDALSEALIPQGGTWFTADNDGKSIRPMGVK